MHGPRPIVMQRATRPTHRLIGMHRGPVTVVGSCVGRRVGKKVGKAVVNGSRKYVFVRRAMVAGDSTPVSTHAVKPARQGMGRPVMSQVRLSVTPLVPPQRQLAEERTSIMEAVEKSASYTMLGDPTEPPVDAVPS
jgi:hypothetical protein